jgi:hypothetical protein
MKTSGLILAVAALSVAAAWTESAMADTYYVATHYESAKDGNSILAVNGDSVRGIDNGHKIAEIASVNAGNVTASDYVTEMDCSAHSWRVNKETDYDLQHNTAPAASSARELPPLTPVNDGTPIRAAMDFICAWPGSKTGAAKATAIDAVDLSKVLGKSLTFDVKPLPGD